MFSCEFCKISKNTFSYKTPPVAASIIIRQDDNQSIKMVNVKSKSASEMTKNRKEKSMVCISENHLL